MQRHKWTATGGGARVERVKRATHGLFLNLPLFLSSSLPTAFPHTPPFAKPASRPKDLKRDRSVNSKSSHRTSLPQPHHRRRHHRPCTTGHQQPLFKFRLTSNLTRSVPLLQQRNLPPPSDTAQYKMTTSSLQFGPEWMRKGPSNASKQSNGGQQQQSSATTPTTGAAPSLSSRRNHVPGLGAMQSHSAGGVPTPVSTPTAAPSPGSFSFAAAAAGGADRSASTPGGTTGASAANGSSSAAAAAALHHHQQLLSLYSSKEGSRGALSPTSEAAGGAGGGGDASAAATSTGIGGGGSQGRRKVSQETPHIVGEPYRNVDLVNVFVLTSLYSLRLTSAVPRARKRKGFELKALAQYTRSKRNDVAGTACFGTATGSQCPGDFALPRSRG